MSTILSLFPSKTLLDVLSLLILHPDEVFYQRAIVQQTGHALLQVQHALERIEQAGFVRKIKSGNRVYYQVETRHPAYQELKQLLLKTVALGDRLRQALQPLRENIRFAFVYGSIAKGEERGDSDIDVFLAGDISLKALSGIMASTALELGREVNPIVYSLDMLQEKAEAQDRFIRELIEPQKYG